MPLLSGCPDPDGRFNEFVSRVPDGRTGAMIDAPPVAQIPDITGTFLLAIHINILPTPIQALATIVMTPSGSTATANFDIVLIDKTARTPIEATRLHVNNVAISSAGELDLVIGTLVIPAAANPLGVEATAENVELPGIITNKDAFCGSVKGNVTKPTPLDLTGSTFGAIRTTPGYTGDQLPPPVGACTTPDGGM